MSSLESQVWEKGRPVQNADPNVWRTDDCGALINREQYGNQTEYGWEIDHTIPKARGGEDDITNLRPLQWLNNQSRKDGPTTCPATWEGTRNVVTCKNCRSIWYPNISSCPQCGAAV